MNLLEPRRLRRCMHDSRFPERDAARDELCQAPAVRGGERDADVGIWMYRRQRHGADTFGARDVHIYGGSADETAALWDYFARKYRRPTRTYVTGQSMGGAASHIAAERYADRFDGALALCGNTGNTNGLMGSADYFAAGAYAAGVTQAE